MAFERDRDASTRHVNAIAALDAVSSRGRALVRARARQMSGHDARLARVALGAAAVGRVGTKLETGTQPPPPPPPTSRLATKIVSATGFSRPTTVATTQVATPPPSPGIVVDVKETEPEPPSAPPSPPPRQTVVIGGGGGAGVATGSRGTAIVMPVSPELVEPLDVKETPAPAITTKHLLIGAGALVGLYLLTRRTK